MLNIRYNLKGMYQHIWGLLSGHIKEIILSKSAGWVLNKKTMLKCQKKNNTEKLPKIWNPFPYTTLKFDLIKYQFIFYHSKPILFGNKQIFHIMSAMN